MNHAYQYQDIPMSNQNQLAQYQQEFTQVLTDQQLSWAKEFQYAVQAMDKNNFLAQVSGQRPETLKAAIINVAAIGISLNPALKHAYLVPRKDATGKVGVCLDISYQGLLHLAIKEGAIEWGQAQLVFEADTYKNNGNDKQPTHNYNPFGGNRGAVLGAYCTVKLPNGDYLTEEMTIDEINYVARTSTNYESEYSPWKKWFSQMARKTVIKRASNYWPKCHVIHEAVAMLNETEGLAAEFVADNQPEAQPQTQSECLNELLEHDEPQVSHETAILEAADMDELTAAGELLKNLPESDEKKRLRKVWMQKKGELSNG